MIGGYSFSTYDELVVFLLRTIAPARVLDIGAGEGKYGRLIRQAGLNDVHITAVEYEAQRRPELLALGYNEVWTQSAMDLLDRPADTYEVVILGDVIEHFRKSDGQDLLEFLNYRSAYIFVITPESMPMSSPHFYEGHNSLWRPQSMQWHDLWLYERNAVMYFYLLRGYLQGTGHSLRDLMQLANGQPFMGHINTNHRNHVPLSLKLHDEVSVDPHPSASGMGVMYRPR